MERRGSPHRIGMVLQREPGIEVVVEAADGAKALELSKELCSDLILREVSISRMDSTEATRSTKGVHLSSNYKGHYHNFQRHGMLAYGCQGSTWATRIKKGLLRSASDCGS